MKFSLSQPAYAVRDASEIAFGLMVLGIVLMPVAAGAGFVVGLFVAMVWSLFSTPPAAIFGACAILLWLGAMRFVIRRYQRVALAWGEERRGSFFIYVIEWIMVGLKVLASFAQEDNTSEATVIFNLFFGFLMLLLLFCHAITYWLLKYRPRQKELIVWAVLGATATAGIWQTT